MEVSIDFTDWSVKPTSENKVDFSTSDIADMLLFSVVSGKVAET